MGAARAERRPRVDGSRTVPHGVDSGREERPLDGHCVGPAATVDEDRLVRFADPQCARLVLAVQRDDPKVAVVLEAVLTAPHGSGAVPSRRRRRRRSASMTRVPRRFIAWPDAVVRARSSSALPGSAMVSYASSVEADLSDVVDHDGVDTATIGVWRHHGPPPTHRIGYGERSQPRRPEAAVPGGRSFRARGCRRSGSTARSTEARRAAARRPGVVVGREVAPPVGRPHGRRRARRRRRPGKRVRGSRCGRCRRRRPPESLGSPTPIAFRSDRTRGSRIACKSHPPAEVGGELLRLTDERTAREQAAVGHQLVADEAWSYHKLEVAGFVAEELARCQERLCPRPQPAVQPAGRCRRHFGEALDAHHARQHRACRRCGDGRGSPARPDRAWCAPPGRPPPSTR